MVEAQNKKEKQKLKSEKNEKEKINST